MTVFQLAIKPEPASNDPVLMPPESSQKFTSQEVVVGDPGTQQPQLEGGNYPIGRLNNDSIQVWDPPTVPDEDVDDGDAAWFDALSVHNPVLVPDLQHYDVTTEDGGGEASCTAEAVVEEAGHG